MQDPTIWQILLSEALIPAIAIFLTSMATILSRRLVKKLEEKWDMDVSERQMKQISEIVEEGVMFAEEKARKAAKGIEGEKGKPLSGPEKMEAAIDYIKWRGEKMGIDDKMEEKSDRLAHMVESKLFKKRLEDKQKSGGQADDSTSQKIKAE